MSYVSFYSQARASASRIATVISVRQQAGQLDTTASSMRQANQPRLTVKGSGRKTPESVTASPGFTVRVSAPSRCTTMLRGVAPCGTCSSAEKHLSSVQKCGQSEQQATVHASLFEVVDGSCSQQACQTSEQLQAQQLRVTANPKHQQQVNAGRCISRRTSPASSWMRTSWNLMKREPRVCMTRSAAAARVGPALSGGRSTGVNVRPADSCTHFDGDEQCQSE